jgi:tetratricopeptide (TPR) repeat protein
MLRGSLLVLAHLAVGIALTAVRPPVVDTVAARASDDGGDGAQTRSRWAALQLAHARLEALLGRHAQATAIARSVVDEAVRLDAPRLEAMALVVRGQNEERNGSLAAAEASMRRAAEVADLVADHETRAEALVHLVFLVGDANDVSRREEALGIAADAAAVLRVTEPDGVLRAQLDHNLAVVAKRGGDLDLARTHAEHALSRFTTLLGDEHPSTLRVLVNLGNILRGQGQLAEAEACLQRAADGFERQFGATHPLRASALSNLAITYAQQKRPADAVLAFRRVLEIREAIDPDHPDVAKAHYNLARALFEAAAYDDALAHYERSLALRRRAGATDDALADLRAAIAKTRERIG